MRSTAKRLLITLFTCSLLFQVQILSAQYRKSVETKEVVLGKLYPRGSRLQLGLQAGTILNQTFISTFLPSASLTYNFSESHSLSLEGHFGITSDTSARCSIESAFSRSTASSFSACDRVKQSGDKDPTDSSNYSTEDPDLAGQPALYSPAYMPIRQVDGIYSANYQFTPVYGKSLWFTTQVVYVDFFLTVGLGVTMSTFWKKLTYPEQELVGPNDTVAGIDMCQVVDGGKLVVDRCQDIALGYGGKYRDSFIPESINSGAYQPVAGGTNGLEVKKFGKSTTKDLSKVGKQGRPPAEAQTSPTLNLGIGTRVYFLRNFLINLELKNYTVLGSDGKGGSDIANFFILTGGVGILF